MKKLFLLLLLLTGHVFAARTKQNGGGEYTQEQKEKMLNQLILISEKIDKLVYRHSNLMSKSNLFRKDHFNQDSKKISQEKDDNEKEYYSKKDEFEDLQSILFRSVKCKISLSLKKIETNYYGRIISGPCTADNYGEENCFSCIKRIQEVFEESGTLPYEYRNKP